MSDQAQGLRALVDQARRDQNGPSLNRAHVLLETRQENERDKTAVSAALRAPLPTLDTTVTLADARLHTSSSSTTSPHARVIAVTSGKGGVGKTNFSSNLSLMLAQAGQRVIVMDADLGLANLHVVLGVMPRYTLEHVMQGERTLEEVLYDGPGGIRIIAGGSGITELANLDTDRREAFIMGLQTLDTLADVIIIDTGAGLSRNVLAFLDAVQEVVVVTTPEPTAITDAYATIKVVSQENPTARLMLVVNMAQSETEGYAVAERINSIARRFIQRDIEFLGYIPHDMSVPRAVRTQQPFALESPLTPAAVSLRQIAVSLGYHRIQSPPNGSMNDFLSRIQRFFGLRTAR